MEIVSSTFSSLSFVFFLLYLVCSMFILFESYSLLVFLLFNIILQGAGFCNQFPGFTYLSWRREVPYWFKRSTSFLGNQRCWSRCQHSMITRFTVAESSAWFDPTSSLHELMLYAIRVLSDVIIDLRRDVLNWLCTFPPAEMQTFAILTVPRDWRITGPLDNPDPWTTFCLRAQRTL